MSAPPLAVTLVLVPRFSLLSLAVCCDALRVANLELGRIGYDWSVATLDGGPAVSSAGVEMSASHAIGDIARSEAIILLSSYEPEQAVDPTLFAWLRRQDRLGAHIACVDTGGYLLAEAGLLRGRPVSVHRESRGGYREQFPTQTFPDSKLVHADRLSSSAGGFVTFQMMLDLIARRDGRALADRVAHVLYFATEDPQDATVDAAPPPLADARLGRLVDQMRSAIDTPRPVSELCRAAHLDPSTAARLCHAAFGVSPGRYYLDLRLSHARHLLLNSVLPVTLVAEMAGFQNPSAFSRAFKKRYGITPSASRQRSSNPGAPQGWSLVSPSLSDKDIYNV